MKRKIMYGGWIPGNPEDREKWLEFGMQGSMHYCHKRTAYPKWGKGYFEHCDATPELMQKLLDERLIPNPNSFTAYYVDTGRQLPHRRQLWGGAGVQKEK